MCSRRLFIASSCHVPVTCCASVTSCLPFSELTTAHPGHNDASARFHRREFQCQEGGIQFYTRTNCHTIANSHPAETLCSTAARVSKDHTKTSSFQRNGHALSTSKSALTRPPPLRTASLFGHSIYRAARSDRPSPSHAYSSHTVTTVDNRNKSLLRVEAHHYHRASGER